MHFLRADQHRVLMKVDGAVPSSIPLKVVKEAGGQLTFVFSYHQSLA